MSTNYGVCELVNKFQGLKLHYHSTFEKEPLSTCTQSVLEAKTGLYFVSIKTEAECLTTFLVVTHFSKDVTGDLS